MPPSPAHRVALQPRPMWPQLQWLPCPATPAPGRALVVLLTWMWAAPQAVAKASTSCARQSSPCTFAKLPPAQPGPSLPPRSQHTAIYHALGCDVAVFTWPALSVWLPQLAKANAAALLRQLAAHLRSPPRQSHGEPSQPAQPALLLVSFSGAAKGVLQPLLESLTEPRPVEPSHTTTRPLAAAASEPYVGAPDTANTDTDADLVRRALRGVAFDSGPVDFDSSVGVRLLANSSLPVVRAAQAAAAGAAAGVLDFALFEVGCAQASSTSSTCCVCNTAIPGTRILSLGARLARAGAGAGARCACAILYEHGKASCLHFDMSAQRRSDRERTQTQFLGATEAGRTNRLPLARRAREAAVASALLRSHNTRFCSQHMRRCSSSRPLCWLVTAAASSSCYWKGRYARQRHTQQPLPCLGALKRSRAACCVADRRPAPRQVFESQRRRMWTSLRDGLTALGHPVLLMCAAASHTKQ